MGTEELADAQGEGMRNLDWSKATISQLYEISCNDPEAGLYKHQAAEEIVRRQRKKRKPFRNNQQKVKAAMPRW